VTLSFSSGTPLQGLTFLVTHVKHLSMRCIFNRIRGHCNWCH